MDEQFGLMDQAMVTLGGVAHMVEEAFESLLPWRLV